MEIWHLAHSTFAIRDGGDMMVFDYWLDEPSIPGRSLAHGVMAFDEYRPERLTVFSSHKHGDHFSKVVFDWRGHADSVRYVLSSDISKRFEAPDVVRMKPHEQAELHGMQIETFRSTDAGVAFLIHWNGRTIYHAGDLHLWLWDEEPVDWNTRMRQRFEAEMALLAGRHVDLAFIPLDPRQEVHATDGIRYFMEHVGAETVFGMHFGDAFADAARLGDSLRTEAWHPHLIVPRHRGECFRLITG